MITRGLGTNSNIITRGFGLLKVAQESIKYFVSAIVKIKKITDNIIHLRKV